MITYEAVLTQMEQALVQAKNAQNEQQMREQLTAIKALCDIVLQQKAPKVAVAPVVQQVPMMPQTQIAPMSQVKMQESDANGDSIFDF